MIFCFSEILLHRCYIRYKFCWYGILQIEEFVASYSSLTGRHRSYKIALKLGSAYVKKQERLFITPLLMLVKLFSWLKAIMTMN